MNSQDNNNNNNRSKLHKQTHRDPDGRKSTRTPSEATLGSAEGERSCHGKVHENCPCWKKTEDSGEAVKACAENGGGCPRSDQSGGTGRD